MYMENRKKLGIIGGMGSRAGALFLKKVIDYSPADTDQDFLEIIFHNNSQVPDRTRAIVYNERSPVNDIAKSIHLFNQQEVEVIALACITSYYYYDQISEFTPAKIMNPLQLVAECIANEHHNIQRVGVLATTGTVNTRLFHTALANCGVEIVTLDPNDQENLFMNAVYGKNGFKSAHISAHAKDLLDKSVKKLAALNVDIIIGGCTEVSIGLEQSAMDIPFIDVVDLLARKTVDYCYNLDTKKYESLRNGQESNTYCI